MRTPVRICLGASLALGALSFAGAANAMPVANLNGASPAIEDVAGGCGPGWRRNNWGECVPMRRRYAPPPPMLFDPWGPPRWRYHHHHHHRNWW